MYRSYTCFKSFAAQAFNRGAQKRRHAKSTMALAFLAILTKMLTECLLLNLYVRGIAKHEVMSVSVEQTYKGLTTTAIETMAVRHDQIYLVFPRQVDPKSTNNPL